MCSRESAFINRIPNYHRLLTCSCKWHSYLHLFSSFSERSQMVISALSVRYVCRWRNFKFLESFIYWDISNSVKATVVLNIVNHNHKNLQWGYNHTQIGSKCKFTIKEENLHQILFLSKEWRNNFEWQGKYIFSCYELIHHVGEVPKAWKHDAALSFNPEKYRKE